MTPPANDLTAPSTVSALLRRHGLAADKGFGQNFLVDRRALERIVDAAGIAPHHRVLEVGPGLGTLTRELAARAAAVTAVELDARLLPVLAETLAGRDNVTVVHADALAFDFGALRPGALFVANLPYNVATAVVSRALEAGVFARLVFLVQKEVAERLAATPGSPAYGAFTLLVAHFAEASVVRLVAPGCFFPPPKVTSAVVRLDVHPGVAPDPELFELIRHGFRHRRKTLVKNLVMAGVPRARARAAVTALGFDERVRAERLALADFRALRERLQSTP